MKKQLIFATLALLIASLACSIQNVQMKTIETQEVSIAETLPDNLTDTELVFKMTGGEFSVHPGASELVNGTIRYNIAQWEPEFTRSNHRYEIKQVNPFRISGIPTGDTVNEWDLAISNAVPLDITIEGGASKNLFNFSGLQISNLAITQGTSDTTIQFDVPNPISMEQFRFTTGASSADLFGLANANFEKMTMSAGAGDYTLDFSGTLNQETSVEIKAGISNLTIIIPAQMKAVVVNEGTVSSINTEGTWLLTDNTYNTLIESGPTLTITLNMSVGNVKLIRQD